MMAGWDRLLGHEHTVARIRQMLSEGRLPHALLFYGKKGIGKRLAADILAESFLCLGRDAPCGTCASCTEYEAGTHPDFHLVEPEDGHRDIRIDQIRKMEQDASRMPMRSHGQAVIIDEAGTMNESAQNSLLKTLEEPSGNRLFILVTESRSSLLQTILSRVAQEGFAPLPVQVVSKYLIDNGVPEAKAAGLAALSMGSIGRAIELNDEGGLEIRNNVISVLMNLGQWDVNGIISQGEFAADLTNAQLSSWIADLKMILRDMLVMYDGDGTKLYNEDIRPNLVGLLPTYTEHKLQALLGLMRMIEKRMFSNANARMQIEGLLLRMQDIIKD